MPDCQENYTIQFLEGSAYNNSSIFTVAGWFNTDQSTGMQTIVARFRLLLRLEGRGPVICAGGI
ncbi:MAG: hypothetical protein PHQ35_09155 [Phycisphaerae bacterium]|nr:hypothetical protein [Phycisphaerae bacterium]MDD5381807.1 hypothetical protein [Phycisphaerae bacterium]